MISVKKQRIAAIKFHHADFTFVAKFPNLEWILCRRGFGKYSHTADGMLGKVK